MVIWSNQRRGTARKLPPRNTKPSSLPLASKWRSMDCWIARSPQPSTADGNDAAGVAKYWAGSGLGHRNLYRLPCRHIHVLYSVIVDRRIQSATDCTEYGLSCYVNHITGSATSNKTNSDRLKLTLFAAGSSNIGCNLTQHVLHTLQSPLCKLA